MANPERMPVQYRAFEITPRKQGDDQPYEFAISSETPVERWYGDEILDHSPASVDMGRMLGMPMLADHDPTRQIGVVESGALGADRVLRVSARWSRNDAAQEIKRDVDDGIRRFVSVGYRVREMRLESTGDSGDTYRVTSWQPLEFSIVAVPADATVGYGRSDAANEEFEVKIIKAHEGEKTNRGYSTMETVVTPQTGATADAATSVRNENAEIVRLCVQYNCPDKAAEWIGKGLTSEQVCREILTARATAPVKAPAPEMVQLTEKEQRAYSICKAISDVIHHGEVRGFEKEISDEVARHLPQSYERRGGFFVPMSIRAGLDSKTSTSGAELKFTQEGPFIELLRNLSVVGRMGATTLTGLTGPVSFPKQSAAGTAYWLAENGGVDVTPSQLALTTVGLAAKTLMANTYYSKQLFVQSSNNVEQLVRRDLLAVCALAIDLAALHGTGSNNQPTGLYGTTGVNAVAMGGVPTHAKILQMVAEVLLDNALAGSLGFATTPMMAHKMASTLVASAAGSNMIWEGKLSDGSMVGYTAMASNQVCSTLSGSTYGGGSEHGILFGDWTQLLIGQFGALEITVNQYLKMAQAMIDIFAFQMADIAVRHPESFCKSTGGTIV